MYEEGYTGITQAYMKLLEDGHDGRYPEDVPGYSPPCEVGTPGTYDDDLEGFYDFC